MSKVERLRALLSVMEQEARRGHFEQLKGLFTAVKNLMGSQTALNPRCILRLLNKEKQVTEALPHSEQKTKLSSFEAEVETAFGSIVVVIQDSVKLCDRAISSRQNPVELVKYRVQVEEKVKYMEKVADAIRQRALVELGLYTQLQHGNAVQSTNLPAPLTLSGSMSNGWRLSDIQRVVRELGGYITGGGTHPYKVVFPNQLRPLPFSKTLDFNGFAASVASVVDLSKKQIADSFTAGHLVE